MSETPTLIDLVLELRRAVGLFDGAMPISPEQAWNEAISEVTEMRRSALDGKCWVCEERAQWTHWRPKSEWLDPSRVYIYPSPVPRDLPPLAYC